MIFFILYSLEPDGNLIDSPAPASFNIFRQKRAAPVLLGSRKGKNKMRRVQQDLAVDTSCDKEADDIQSQNSDAALTESSMDMLLVNASSPSSALSYNRRKSPIWKFFSPAKIDAQSGKEKSRCLACDSE